MTLVKSDDFIADVENIFEYYFLDAGLVVARRYLKAVESTCNLLAQYPELGPHRRFKDARLRNWRFFVLPGAFHKHLLFYEVTAEAIIMRRAMHGNRDIKHRLLQKPS